MAKTSGSFKKGHKYCGPKMGSFLGGKHSEESKKKNREKHLGKKYPNRKSSPLTEEHKKNIKIGGTGLKRKGLALQHIIETNQKPWTDKRRKQMSEYKTGDKNSMFGKHLSDETKRKKREKMLLKPNRKFKETGIEIKIEEELKKRNIIYKKQKPLCKIAIVDFYLPNNNVIIQADGCYWHNCPTCKNKKANWKREENKDLKQDLILTFNGFKVYRFWEHDINESVENCINSIVL